MTKLQIPLPKLYFEKITFSGGQSFDLKKDDIVVFVGPNNAGKSAALKELALYLSHDVEQSVIKSVKLGRVGNAGDLQCYLDVYAKKKVQGNNTSYQGMNFDIGKMFISSFDDPHNRFAIVPFFCGRCLTENRITSSNPAGSIALHTDIPKHPIHQLMQDPDLGSKVSKLFKFAFGQDLFVFLAGGAQFPLHVGPKPIIENGDNELSKNYVGKVLAETKPLHFQGDGMRSFATVLLEILISNTTSVQLLDEPEAFLHPPQARLLGEYIAKEREADSQLFISTHSTDILEGLIKGSPKVRIFRIERFGNRNDVSELSAEKTSALVGDTLIRYSNVVSGIFYKHVFIAESDSDCLFYNAILHTTNVSGTSNPDVLFVHSSGKHRIKTLVETLRSLNVPTSVIVDVDILNEQNAFRSLYESLGGSWDDVARNWSSVNTAVLEARLPMNAEQIKSMIISRLETVGGPDPLGKDVERDILKIIKSQSAWQFVKQAGRNALRGGTSVKQYDELIDKCKSVGLWIVPVGELENFCRDIEAKHGPDFVEKVLEQRNLENDPHLNEARVFMKSIWDQACAWSSKD